ncbi:MAG: ARMT1-like domain-containing protein [Thermotogae bacterium]|nr:ARMT1-like domain-containing protein [Thermotogota bacterium]
MKATKACFACVVAQAERNLYEWNGDEKAKFEVMKSVSRSLEKAQYGMKPIELSKITNDTVRIETGVVDLYKERKLILNQKAKEVLPEIKDYANSSENPLKAFAIAAILGNHLDFGVKDVAIDSEFVDLIKSKMLAIDDFDLLTKKLVKAHQLLYILDNTGEVVFDKSFIEAIKKRYDLKIKVAVRSEPIINDVTLKEAVEVGFVPEEIIESGSNMAGMTIEIASKEFLDFWRESDVIVAKGQGNFEGLDEVKDERLFFLLESKCPVISEILEVNLGDIVLKQSRN